MWMLDQRTEKRSTYHLQDRLAGPRRNTISTKGWLFLVFVSTSAVGQLHRNACQANRIRGDPPTQLCATLIHKLCKVRTVLLSLTKQWMDVYTAETSQCASYLMNYLLGRLQTICISTRKQRSGVAIELTKNSGGLCSIHFLYFLVPEEVGFVGLSFVNPRSFVVYRTQCLSGLTCEVKNVAKCKRTR